MREALSLASAPGKVRSSASSLTTLLTPYHFNIHTKDRGARGFRRAAKMDPRFDTILRNLRRRDNIRDFIDGLEDTECWPYPDGNEAPKPATFEDWSGPITVEVKLREDKAYELMHFYLINVSRYHPFAPFDRKSDHDSDLTNVSIYLCPEEGPGAYTVEYVVDKTERSHAPKLELQSFATLRSFLMHRYEWVVNKLHSVNSDRRDAWKRVIAGLESDEDVDDCLGHENEEDLEEEENHDAVMNDDACVSGSTLSKLGV